jgi:hypothetical protein
VHEAPALGLAGDHHLVEGDVIAIEPGIEGLDGIGGGSPAHASRKRKRPR